MYNTCMMNTCAYDGYVPKPGKYVVREGGHGFLGALIGLVAGGPLGALVGAWAGAQMGGDLVVVDYPSGNIEPLKLDDLKYVHGGSSK